MSDSSADAAARTATNPEIEPGTESAAVGEAIRLRSVSVRFSIGGDRPLIDALVDVDLTVATSERVALLGESGAGKSTLLDVVAGLTPPTSGAVEVLGAPLDALRGRAMRRHRAAVGVVRQAQGVPGAMRVVHNVNGGRLGSWSTWRAITSLVRPRRMDDVERTLASVGLAGMSDRTTAELSGGQQQRVAVARALVEPRRLLLADEPVSAVDPRLSDDVLASLCGAETRPALVISLHDPDLARRHVDRIIGLRDGRVLFDRPAGDVSDPDLDELYRVVPD
ncbi:MAG: ATP-binding cassette domain-containing protein [Actinomycetota bacterium]